MFRAVLLVESGPAELNHLSCWLLGRDEGMEKNMETSMVLGIAGITDTIEILSSSL